MLDDSSGAGCGAYLLHQSRTCTTKQSQRNAMLRIWQTIFACDWAGAYVCSEPLGGGHSSNLQIWRKLAVNTFVN